MPESQQDINISAEPSSSLPPRSHGRGVAMTTAEREEPLVIFDKMSDKKLLKKGRARFRSRSPRISDSHSGMAMGGTQSEVT